MPTTVRGTTPWAARVLVVDDHFDTLELLSTYLTIEGFDVVTAGNGPEALIAANWQPFDLMITDLAMPGMDGAGLIEAIRCRGCRPLPIIVVTGQSGSWTADGLRVLGACRLLTKPFDPQTLVVVARTLLDTCAHDCECCPNR